MIYAVIGTEVSVREKAKKRFVSFGTPSRSVRAENVQELEGHIDAFDLFDTKPMVIVVEEVTQDALGRDTFLDLVPRMKSSKNIFLVDEPFALAEVKKVLKGHAEELFEAVEKTKERVFPFALCNAIADRDKKSAWVEWMKVREEEGELVLGALWWQVKKVWASILAGKRGAYTKQEIENLAEKIVVMQHEAHRGKVDLKVEMEKLVLSL